MHDGPALRIVHKPLDRAWIESFFFEQTSLRQPSEPDAQEAVQIQGFDIPCAIANFMGYETAFFNILREFPDYGTKFISEYSSYLQTNNLKECTRLAHSIKGSALMIGATEINMLAMEIESACFSSSDTQHIEIAFKRMEEKILEASRNVKNHFLQKNEA
jgi:HPt (histidine-containing phosphotransfer) domain-containing protein